MPRPFRTQLVHFLATCAITILIGLVLSSSARATNLYLNEKFDLINPELAKFLEKLAAGFRKKHNLPEEYSETGFNFGKYRLAIDFADLNGDGVEELLVLPITSYTCGTFPACPLSIYTPDDGGWRYIGGAYATSFYDKLSPDWALDGDVIRVEDNRFNGWRTLSIENLDYGEPFGYRYCWVTETEPERDYLNEDIFGMPMEPGQAGYFWNVDIKKECANGYLADTD